MTTSRWDVTINSVKYRLIRGEGAYEAGMQRQELSLNEVVPSSRPVLKSRGDQQIYAQTSWSGGTRWEKPIYGNDNLTTLNISRQLDTWSRPGQINFVAQHFTRNVTAANVRGYSRGVRVGSKMFFVGQSTVVSSPNVDIYEISSTGTVSQESYHAGTSDAEVYGICYDRDNNLVFFVNTTGIYRFTPDSGSAAQVVAISAIYPGANLFMHNGRLIFYDGDVVYSVESRTGTGSLTSIEDDGMGRDFLASIGAPSGVDPLVHKQTLRLCIPTSEGIFYIKNVVVDGLSSPYIWRIDRDSSGTNIATPIATLPAGLVALDMASHMGAIMVTTTSEVNTLLKNDISAAGDVPIEVYFLSGSDLGSIGTMLDPDNLDETPYQFLGTVGRNLLIAGRRRIWGYDPIRGGLHVWWHTVMTNNNVVPGGGAWHTIFHTENGSGQGEWNVYGQDNNTTGWHSKRWFDKLYGVTNSVSTAADTEHELESNYFDFNLPFESKTITHVTLQLGGLATSDAVKVLLSTDDGAYSAIATFTSADGAFATKALSSPATGNKFRYKLQFVPNASANDAITVYGIDFRARSGENVKYWHLTIDGTQTIGVENTVQSPLTVFDNLVALAGTETTVTFVDNFEDDDPTQTTSYTVKVAAVQIIKDEPGEALARVRLVEA